MSYQTSASPSRTTRRWSAFLLLAAILLAGPTYADKKEDLDELRKKIATMQKEMAEISQNETAVADALREFEKGISHSNRKLAEISTQKQQTDQQLQQLKQQAQRLEGSLVQQQQATAQLLRQQYMGGQQEYWRLLLNNQAPGQTARQLEYYRYIARERSLMQQKLRHDINELNRIHEATRQQSSSLASLEQQQAQELQVLQQERLAREQTREKIAQQLKQQRKEIQRLQRDEAQLADLIKRLSKIIAKPSKKTAKTAAEPSNSSKQVVMRSEDEPDDRFDGTPFASLKGKLALPVRGEVINRYGSARPDSTVLWKGLFVRSASGQAIKSVAAGRVVFSDWMRGFGNLMVIDHGGGYMSIYGNNETLYKQVGDKVKGGETVATVGNSGGNEDSGLYFELRHKSEPFDPTQWLASR